MCFSLKIATLGTWRDQDLVMLVWYEAKPFLCGRQLKCFLMMGWYCIECTSYSCHEELSCLKCAFLDNWCVHALVTWQAHIILGEHGSHKQKSLFVGIGSLAFTRGFQREESFFSQFRGFQREESSLANLELRHHSLSWMHISLACFILVYPSRAVVFLFF